MTDIDMSQYLGIFLDEAEEQLQQLDEAVVLLEQNPGNSELLHRIFRIAHTLKGSSASMGFEKMATLTHRMESVLDALRQGRLAVSRKVVDLLLACLDKLRELKEQLVGGTEGGVEVGGLVAELESLLEGETEAAVAPEDTVLELTEVEQNVIREAELRGYQGYEIYVELEPDCRMKGARAFLVFNNLEDYGEVIKSQPHTQELEAEKFGSSFRLILISKEDADTLANVIKSISEIRRVEVNPVELHSEAPTSAPGQFSKAGRVSEPGSAAVVARGRVGEHSQQASTVERHKTQTVRVDVRRLETLMNLVGELVIDRTRLVDVGNALKNKLGNESLLQTLEEISMHIGRVTSELQEEVMKARMLPIDQVFNRFPRMVRDLANKAGKEIDFIVEGRETELDRTVIEEIGDPLIHLLRNAIDHGIEPPEERVRLGKPRHGTIILKAFHQENMIVITVQDDGRGMDPEVIKRKAVEKGLISPEQAARMNSRDALDLIFLPGFSTSDKVTDVSGRGVGMDIVRARLEKINGILDIKTTPGEGTCFTIKLPLTLAINRSLLVTLSGQVYAIPLANVIEIIEVEPAQVKKVQRHEVVVVREKVLPLLHLGEVLGIRRDVRKVQGRVAVVVVGVAEKQAGFIVDSLLGEQEIVIKSLGNYIGKIPGVAGATIMGDGRVALILDVRGLIENLPGEGSFELAG
ncbi:MAG: chemotaxis protein CheA [Thermanaeromonas sp.]|uniref:chemotaxis protein CheA n=1 Tax=Thermanaeromonas sp. TaxID=2003697 RepID=UPI00243A3B95|nr:chemotaxis protein CheA [Thermanaeromonas sp.]MCG0278461.1 chemotaxis protein CheA [Thermanaeromonas sp.]